MFNRVLDYVSKFIKVSPALAKDLTGRLEYHTVPKKNILLHSGEVCNHVYFILNGLLVSYYEHEEKEIANWFLMEGEVTMSLLSFYRREPSVETIMALEDCELVLLHHDDLMELYSSYPDFNILGRKLTEYYHCESEERWFAMRKQTAKSKYEWLMNNRADVIKRVPHKYIASYLGINEETLSRIRAGYRHKC